MLLLENLRNRRRRLIVPEDYPDIVNFVHERVFGDVDYGPSSFMLFLIQYSLIFNSESFDFLAESVKLFLAFCFLFVVDNIRLELGRIIVDLTLEFFHFHQQEVFWCARITQLHICHFHLIIFSNKPLQNLSKMQPQLHLKHSWILSRFIKF